MISVKKKLLEQENMSNMNLKLVRINQKMQPKQNYQIVKPQSESPFSHKMNFLQKKNTDQKSNQQQIPQQKINFIQTKNTPNTTIDQIYSHNTEIFSFNKNSQSHSPRSLSFHQAKFVKEEYILHQNILKHSSELQDSSFDEQLPLGVSTKLHQYILNVNNCSKRKESSESTQSQPRKRVKKIFEDFKCAGVTSSQRKLNDDLENFKLIQNKHKNAFLNKYQHYIFQQQLPREYLKQHLISLAYNLNQAFQYANYKPTSLSRVYLPAQNSQKKTLLLDLDETLVHLIELPKDHPNPELKCNSVLFTYQFRPFAHKFLKRMAQWFEIGVFTAGDKLYADFIVDKIDKERNLISFVLDKSFLTEIRNGVFIKDLDILQGRSLKNIIIIDNLVQSFANQLPNGIPIFEWTGAYQEDKELKYLAKFLKTIKGCEDVRIPINNHFNLDLFFQDAQKYILENQFENQ